MLGYNLCFLRCFRLMFVELIVNSSVCCTNLGFNGSFNFPSNAKIDNQLCLSIRFSLFSPSLRGMNCVFVFDYICLLDVLLCFLLVSFFFSLSFSMSTKIHSFSNKSYTLHLFQFSIIFFFFFCLVSA